MAKMKGFDEMIDALLNNLKIEKPKAPKYIEHIYADFIELNALFFKEEVTLSDISDLLNDVKDSNIVKQDEESDLNEIASDTTERNDQITDRIQSIFEICFYRSKLYQEDEYPFELFNNQIKIKSDITDKQKIYLFLLISSNLNYFESLESILTKEFELLSLYCLMAFLSPKAKVKSFGKNSEYTGNAIKKISTLSNELCIKPNLLNIHCISRHNVQERGCDIIAWIPFEDKIPNMLILLCQCACGKDWEQKQAETNLFANYFYFVINPIHTMFVPYALANTEKSFHQNDRIANNLFFERKRIIEQFEDTDFFKKFESFSVLGKFINTRIEIN